MSCGCGSGSSGGELYEARTVGGGTLTLSEDGRTQGTRAEAIQAARNAPSSAGAYLKKV